MKQPPPSSPKQRYASNLPTLIAVASVIALGSGLAIPPTSASPLSQGNTVAASHQQAATQQTPTFQPTTVDLNSRNPQLTYNGPNTCQPTDESGNVRALPPGACAQFGTVGQERTNAKAKNVILIIGDGLGQQEITAARNYLHGAAGRFPGIDSFTSVGAYTHHSIDRKGEFNYVTDSAASATAWSTGVKTYNGAIGLDLAEQPQMTLLEKAKKAGLRTGNVTTSEIQDATPAAAATHALHRKCYTPQIDKAADTCKGDAASRQYRENGGWGSISEQLIDVRADITLGGGKKSFEDTVRYSGPGKTPFLDTPTNWVEGKTVLENAEANGFQIVTDKTQLGKLEVANQDKPVLGLFNDGNMVTRFAPTKATDGGAKNQPLSCEKQDVGTEPELAAMTSKALELLNDPSSPKGFFLQIESASVDKRAHAADACGMIGEVERLDEAVQVALEFAREDGNTLVLLTADHAHSTQILYDNSDSVSATTRLLTADQTGMTVGYGTIPKEDIVSGQKFSTQHNGSQLRVAAFGPGEENIIGQIDQTDLFFVMANALELNDLPTISPSTKIPESAKTISANTQERKKSEGANATCYQVEANKVVSQPGQCAQFGTDGQELDHQKAKNAIIFIGDGMGDSEITSARNYLHGANGRLPGIDALPFTGYYTTFALNPKRGGPDYVTDSAASATGWASGVKTYNGALGITVDGQPVPNLIELAKAKGMKTGNVTTSEIQDATPAAMGSHVPHRKCYGPEYEANGKSCQGDQFKALMRENGGLGSISEQLIDTRADITMGGGGKALQQIVQVSGQWGSHQWTKGKSVLENAKNQGFQVVLDLNSLEGVKAADQTQPVLGVFADGNLARLLKQTIPTTTGPKEPSIKCEPNPDFSDSTPTLAQMTAKSLELLQNENGFLLQVESSSVDKADHDADICGQIGEVHQLDQAIAVAREWVEKSGEPTLIITTADHAHASQIVANGILTAGRATKLETADGNDMTVNYATSTSNADEDALGGQSHTGAQLRVAAEGPGAANVVGQIDQTDIHYVVANALDLYKDNPTFDFTPQFGKSSAPSTATKWILICVAAVILIGIGITAFTLGRKRAVGKPKTGK